MTRVAIILPAAGASSRMRGADKLLQEVAGQPLLRVMARRACAASSDVFVTLPGPDHPRAVALDGLPVTRVMVPDAAEGMAASLRRAVAALPRGIDGAMILPADMPEIGQGELRILVNAFQDDPHEIIRGASAGKPGHPVLFPADLLPGFAMLTGDQGARPILEANRSRVRLVDLPNGAALTDLDTPEAWAAWRGKT